MFLETIRCEGGIPLHLSYHQRRLDATLAAFGIERRYSLSALVSPPDEKVYRCRILYGAEGAEIGYHPYLPRTLSSLKLVRADTVDYGFKYADRGSLDALFAQRGECDDIVIVRNGFLTDTAIANIALWIEGKWYTPEHPLLRGTTRERLIGEGFLTPAPLDIGALARAQRVAVMNAMVGFVEVENGIIT